jgi:hypothetical protein
MAGIGHPQALIDAFVPTAEGAKSPKMEFFDAVACLRPGLAEHNCVLDQGGQIHVHW